MAMLLGQGQGDSCKEGKEACACMACTLFVGGLNVSVLQLHQQYQLLLRQYCAGVCSLC